MSGPKDYFPSESTLKRRPTEARRMALKVKTSKSLGKCYQCKSPRIKGQIRCEYHAALNRARCKNNAKNNPEEDHLKYLLRKAISEELGTCIVSPKHGPKSKDSILLCDICLKKRRKDK